MRLNLLDFAVCPECGDNLICLSFEAVEKAPNFEHICGHWCSSKRLLLPEEKTRNFPVPNTFPGLLQFENPERKIVDDCRKCHRLFLSEAALFCTSCPRYFPVRRGIPEILPAALRDERRDLEFLASYRERLGLSDVFYEKFLASRPSEPENKDADGPWKYHRAEMALPHREDLPSGFFGPAGTLPFEPLHPVRSADRMLRFLTAVRQLDLRRGDAVLDLGVGYAWTSEWLKKLGYSVIGVDLSRAYLEAGLRRAPDALPPLLISDIENLPFRKGMFQGILVFDAFHHVADRRKSLRTFSEILTPGGRLVMAEPGPKHESQPASLEAMKKFGILEKGISRRSVERLIDRTAFKSRPLNFLAAGRRKLREAFLAGARFSEKAFRKVSLWIGGPGISVERIPHPTGDVEILLLRKQGRRIYTSKNPDLLRAKFALPGKTYKMSAGAEWTLRFSLENSGNTVWLGKTEDGLGEVKVGFRLKGTDGTLLNENFLKVPLLRDVSPGESLGIEASMPVLSSPGTYILEVDLLAEGIMWFKDSFYAPEQIVLEVSPAASVGKKG
jgi:SAM-dependent methyltransferase/uncharacterized protein YbaR (Trm112 family)